MQAAIDILRKELNSAKSCLSTWQTSLQSKEAERAAAIRSYDEEISRQQEYVQHTQNRIIDLKFALFRLGADPETE